jgi:hypothetical protein
MVVCSVQNFSRVEKFRPNRIRILDLNFNGLLTETSLIKKIRTDRIHQIPLNLLTCLVPWLIPLNGGGGWVCARRHPVGVKYSSNKYVKVTTYAGRFPWSELSQVTAYSEHAAYSLKRKYYTFI